MRRIGDAPLIRRLLIAAALVLSALFCYFRWSPFLLRLSRKA